MNAAFTANPDFAQVEADQLVLTVNQRFPIFYDEKRPFFLEGIDTFQTPITIIHTRTIVDPGYAVKLTGKHGGTTLGVLCAADGAGKAAVRLKRDVGRESTVGGAMTSDRKRRDVQQPRERRCPAATERSDGVHRADRRQVRGHAVSRPVVGGTRQRYGQGLGYYAKIERRSRHVVTAPTASGSSPDYRADLGFTRRANMNAIAIQTTYNSEPQARRAADFVER